MYKETEKDSSIQKNCGSNYTDTSSVQPENLTAETMQTVRGRVIKAGLGAAVVAKIKLAANNAVSIAKNAVGRIGERAAIKKARSVANRVLRVWGRIPGPFRRLIRGILGGLTQYLDGNPWYEWCSWRATRAMIIGGVFAL